MRLLMTPAHVTLASDGFPQTISWLPTHAGAVRPASPDRPRRVINVIDAWRYDGRWWEERELHRDYYLVDLEGGIQAEIFREDDTWWIARVTD